MCTKNHNHMRYSSWDTEWDRVLSFWEIFCPLDCLPPLTNQKAKIKKKNEKASVDVITLNLCNKNRKWSDEDMKCNRHNFLSFWTIFCSFAPPLRFEKNIKKHMEILKVWKKCKKKTLGDIIFLHMCTIN